MKTPYIVVEGAWELHTYLVRIHYEGKKYVLRVDATDNLQAEKIAHRRFLGDMKGTGMLGIAQYLEITFD